MDETLLNNEAIYDLLNLDTKYDYKFISIEPDTNGIKYNSLNYIYIFRNKIILGYIGNNKVNLQLNKKETNVSNVKNKRIIFDSIKFRFCINIIENMTIMNIICKINIDTDRYNDYNNNCFCALMCYSDMVFEFNKNVILGDDTIRMLKEKEFSIYYYIKSEIKNIIIGTFTETKQYVCFWKNIIDNIDNDIFICDTFKGLGKLGKSSNEQLVTNYYITNLTYTKC